ncbi:DUF302 domain-containing protein [Bacteroidota bacterium]
MKKKFLPFIFGLILGVIMTGILAWIIIPGLILNVYRSTLNFEETVSAINESVLERGWKVPKIYDIQKSLQSAGHLDMTKVKIISVCQPHQAYEMLMDDENKKVTAIMPCRIGVYEAEHGDVFISKMNIRLMSKIFGGKIAKVMSKVADGESEMLKGIIAE